MKIFELIEESKLNQNLSEKMIGDLLKISSKQLFLRKNSLILSPAQINKFKKLENKVLSGVPLQYVLKEADFYGRQFKVNEDVLIPRPETEILLQKALKVLELRIKNKELGKRPINIVDVGTGSGCVAISLAREFENLRPANCDLNLFAIDISEDAIKLARQNAKRYDVNVGFLKSNLLKNSKLPKKFDLILANLPYLPSDYLKNYPADIAKPLRYEPRLALDGGKDGLDLINQLIVELPSRLEKSGLAIFEIDPSEQQNIINLTKKTYLKVRFTKDLNGHIRFALISH